MRYSFVGTTVTNSLKDQDKIIMNLPEVSLTLAYVNAQGFGRYLPKMSF